MSLAVYRVTNLFPQGEALTYQARELANQIVADLVANQRKEAIAKIKILLEYFHIAKVQNWTKELNFDILNKEYKILLAALRLRVKGGFSKEKIPASDNESICLSPRQAEILNHAKKLKVFQIAALAERFSSPRRTLNRDIEYLCAARLIKKSGQGRSSFYKVTT